MLFFAIASLAVAIAVEWARRACAASSPVERWMCLAVVAVEVFCAINATVDGCEERMSIREWKKLCAAKEACRERRVA